MKLKASKRLGKVLFSGLASIFILGALAVAAVFILSACVKASAKDKILTADNAASVKADCILILGAGVYSDNSPSPMLEDRLSQGVALYENGASDRLLMSGDHGRKDYDEVNAMKRFAVDKGVPSAHVFMDHAGFSTYESIYRAKDVFKARKIIIVTQRYHLYRALYIADKLGLEAFGVASDPRSYSGQQQRELREVLARAKDFFSAIIKPAPTYLGDAIPVTGDGDATND